MPACEDSPVQGPGGWWGFAIALIMSLGALMWWPVVGLGTENFGSDCLFYFGESGPKANHCHEVTDTARTVLPWLVLVAGAGTLLSFGIPRRFRVARHLAVLSAVICALAAFGIGGYALQVSQP